MEFRVVSERLLKGSYIGLEYLGVLGQQNLHAGVRRVVQGV